MGKIKHAEEFVYQAVEAGYFEIDRQGRIWRIARPYRAKRGAVSEPRRCKRKRSESFTGTYYQIHFFRDGKKMSAQASRLVWRHFNGPIPKELTINHKNGCKTDNRLCNLELATDSEQQIHAIKKLGHKPYKNFNQKSFRGELNGHAVLNKDAVIKIRNSSAGVVSLAKEFGVSPSHISAIRNKKSWSHIR